MGSKKQSDPRGQHTRLYHDLQDSPAWRALSFADRGLYVELRRQLKSFNNGNINAAMGTLKHAGVKSPTTLAKGLRSLLAVGLIAKTREGGVARGERQCNLYRFTDEPCFDIPKFGIKATPATNEWKRFTTIAQASAAIDECESPTPSPVRRAARKNASRIQILERDATDSGNRTPSDTTDSVDTPPPPSTDSVAGKNDQNLRKPAPALAFN